LYFQELRDSIRIGMVDCFDVESDLEAHRSLSQKPIDSSLSVGEIRGLCALSLLQLLNASVNKPMPNFAHFLLGFDMRDPARTKFENPGKQLLLSVALCIEALYIQAG